MCDDLFDESGDEKDIHEISWRKTIDEINKDGFRSGIEHGQEERVQEGFNSTFAASSRLLYTVSSLRGQISGKLSYNLIKPGTYSADQINHLEALLKDLLEYETELLIFSSQLYSKIQSNEEEFDKLTTNGHCVNQIGDSIEQSVVETTYLASAQTNSAITDSLSATTERKNNDLDNSSDSCSNKDSLGFKINRLKHRLSAVLKSGS